jgi:hypothetical protein
MAREETAREEAAATYRVALTERLLSSSTA